MRGRLLQRLRARAGFPAPSRIVWRGTYEDTYHLPVTEVDERGNTVRYRYDLDDGVPNPWAADRRRASRWDREPWNTTPAAAW